MAALLALGSALFYGIADFKWVDNVTGAEQGRARIASVSSSRTIEWPAMKGTTTASCRRSLPPALMTATRTVYGRLSRPRAAAA
jgi:hypothetical protein